MRRIAISVLALGSILFGALTAGSPTMSDTPTASTAGIESATPAHHVARVEATLPQILSPGGFLRLLVQALWAGIVVLAIAAIVPLRTHLGIPLAAGRRGPPSLNG